MSEDGITGPDDPRHEPRSPVVEPAARVIVSNAEARPGGDVRAGWLVAQMDLAASSVAVRHSRGRCAAVAIDAIAFPVPIRLGDELSMRTRILETGRTSMRVAVEARRRPGDRDDRNGGERVTGACFTVAALDPFGRPRAFEGRGP